MLTDVGYYEADRTTLERRAAWSDDLAEALAGREPELAEEHRRRAAACRSRAEAIQKAARQFDALEASMDG